MTDPNQTENDAVAEAEAREFDAAMADQAEAAAAPPQPVLELDPEPANVEMTPEEQERARKVYEREQAEAASVECPYRIVHDEIVRLRGIRDPNAVLDAIQDFCNARTVAVRSYVSEPAGA